MKICLQMNHWAGNKRDIYAMENYDGIDKEGGEDFLLGMEIISN